MSESEKTYKFKDNEFRIFCTESPDKPWHASWFSFEDESEIRASVWNIQPGDNVLDIGAAFGSYTLCALSAGANFVWSWSPQTGPGESYSEFEYLTKSLELNGWENKCKIYRTGIYGQSGFLHTESQQMVDTIQDWMTIKVEPLDSWAEREIPNETSIDWIKMDVEGAEADALKSGEKLLLKFKPKIFVENHMFKDKMTETMVCEYLTSLGYQQISTTPHHGVSHSLYVFKE